ncbi:MAG: GntR family transcriptional regulator [Alkalicoccus sp.]|nr:MAG: GntR family transcriptional regulator [Alkalicoccus sp.]
MNRLNRHHLTGKVIVMNKPLHLTIFEDIYSKIKSNYYPEGTRLPTEAELQEIYGVSRSPVREALGKLKNEGFITRKAGVGSVVAETSVSGPWRPMGGFSGNFDSKTEDLDCKTVDVSKVIAEEYITKELRVEKNEPLTKVTRVRREKKKPVLLLLHYYKNVDLDKIREAGDILYMRQFASEVLGIRFEHVKEELTAVAADNNLSYLLDVEEGHPLLNIKRTSYDAEGHPVEFVEYYVKTEDWPYKVSFSRKNLDKYT